MISCADSLLQSSQPGSASLGWPRPNSPSPAPRWCFCKLTRHYGEIVHFSVILAPIRQNRLCFFGFLGSFGLNLVHFWWVGLKWGRYLLRNFYSDLIPRYYFVTFNLSTNWKQKTLPSVSTTAIMQIHGRPC